MATRPLRLGLLDQRPRLLGREGQRLLDDQVLAGGECRLDDLAVVVGADDDGIDGGVGDQRPVVAVERADAILRAERLQHARRDVAERGDAELPQFLQDRQVHQLGDLAAADDADADALCRSCQPLTAPAVRPAMNCRCIRMKTTITGSVVIISAAK